MKSEIARIGVALILLTSAGSVACDREDRADVREGVKDVEREVDQLDTDGKDD